MSQANVYTSASSQSWYTDKARISTGTNSVTYNVNLVYGPATGNLYSNPIIIPANNRVTVWVGVGNQLTITGGNCTIQEVGTGSSGQLAVN
jgi:hypothetical protein